MHSVEQNVENLPPTSIKLVLKELRRPFLFVFAILCLEASIKAFEGILLCRYSLHQFNASMYAFTFLNMLQKFFIRFANSGFLFEDKKYALEVGNRVWQVIWTSLLSLFVVFPLSFLIEKLLLRTPLIGEAAASYFSISILGIALFPIVSILSAFYRAQNKKRLILGGLAIMLIVSLFFNFSLIPLYGVIGAASSSFIARLVFCSILFCYFLTPSHRKIFSTHDWTIDWKAIWGYMQKPNPLLKVFILNFIAYAIINVCMALKGEAYLSSFSIGSAITFFSTCFSHSIYYAFVQLFYKYQKSRSAGIFKIGAGVSLILGSILSIPCLFFPQLLLSLFLGSSYPTLYDLYQTMLWVGVWIFTSHLYATPLAFLTSAGKAIFYSKIERWVLVTTVFQAVYFIQYLECQPHTYWMILCGENVILAISLFLKAYLVYKKSIPVGTYPQ